LCKKLIRNLTNSVLVEIINALGLEMRLWLAGRRGKKEKGLLRNVDSAWRQRNGNWNIRPRAPLQNAVRVQERLVPHDGGQISYFVDSGDKINRVNKSRTIY